MANKTSVHVQSKGKPFEAVIMTTLLSLMKSKKKPRQVSEPDQLDCVGVGFSDLIKLYRLMSRENAFPKSQSY